jgi:tRNA(Ile)-lysidine synthase
MLLVTSALQRYRGTVHTSLRLCFHVPQTSFTCTTIEKKVYDSLIHSCGLRQHDKILLSVSGGVDSLALLHILQAVKLRYALFNEFRIIHFNHKRRNESEEEAVFVSSLAQHYNMTLYTRELSTATWIDEVLPTSQNKGFQAQSRQWRRSESESILQAWKQEYNRSTIITGKDTKFYIATAHQMDDHVETFFLKLLRGSHISRLYSVSHHLSHY